jgi:hypothetical protein
MRNENLVAPSEELWTAIISRSWRKKAAGGDLVGEYLYQILVLMYIYATKYMFLIVCSFKGFFK